MDLVPVVTVVLKIDDKLLFTKLSNNVNSNLSQLNSNLIKLIKNHYLVANTDDQSKVFIGGPDLKILNAYSDNGYACVPYFVKNDGWYALVTDYKLDLVSNQTVTVYYVYM